MKTRIPAAHTLLLLFTGVMLLLAACTSPGSRDIENGNTPFSPEMRKNADQLLSARGINGTFVLQNLNGSQEYIYNESRSNEGFLPSATFHLFSMLVFLQEGIADVHEKITWDEQDHGWSEINRDLTPGEALKYSADWVFYALSDICGRPRMQYWLSRTGYGNRIATGGKEAFWQSGDLRITARQQVDFLQRLYRRELPFDAEVQDEVVKMIERARDGRVIYFFKTGWTRVSNPDLVWNIGIVRTGDDVYFFALNMDAHSEEEAEWRKSLPEELLVLFGILPENMRLFPDI